MTNMKLFYFNLFKMEAGSHSKCGTNPQDSYFTSLCQVKLEQTLFHLLLCHLYVNYSFTHRCHRKLQHILTATII